MKRSLSFTDMVIGILEYLYVLAGICVVIFLFVIAGLFTAKPKETKCAGGAKNG
ncbi:MAG: hypothetical protein CEN89_313 [Candidatus Berkelbacteria bacterium Licking1014_7]|uniref:Uncharacterized protein n=1 Tax=Candidatus Berkelbacteria bacterium Licking1014_7 TaxID=2017147 RepID=A0A554LJM3_9BACT|nr:MAG: hypothetical protein CEN89_313 [Candidatus Berkelbacteria bacterium Licking1014_7]